MAGVGSQVILDGMAGRERRCAVVGAGLTGLVAAHRLASAGWKVTVFERYPEPGGLVASFAVGGERLECFYHHLFTTDTDYVALAGGARPRRRDRVAPVAHGDLLGGPAVGLRHAGLAAQVRPAAVARQGALRRVHALLNRTADYRRFETVTARDWILAPRRAHGVRHRLGPAPRTRSSRRRRTRSRWSGCGGRCTCAAGRARRAAWASASATCAARSGASSTRSSRVCARPASASSWPTRCGGSGAARTASRCRRGPASSASTRCCSPRPQASWSRWRATSCPTTTAPASTASPRQRRCASCSSSSRSLSPYYWLNIADPEFPFGGFIEHTNYIPRERYGGRHVLYISKYLFADDPLWSARDDEVWATYRPFLQRVNPAFDDGWVLARHHFKAAYAQPVIPCNYPSVIPPFETPMPGLYPRLHGADLPRGPRPELRRPRRQPRRRSAAGPPAAMTIHSVVIDSRASCS